MSPCECNKLHILSPLILSTVVHACSLTFISRLQNHTSESITTPGWTLRGCWWSCSQHPSMCRHLCQPSIGWSSSAPHLHGLGALPHPLFQWVTILMAWVEWVFNVQCSSIINHTLEPGGQPGQNHEGPAPVPGTACCGLLATLIAVVGTV